MDLCLAPLDFTFLVVLFPELYGPTSLSLYPSTSQLSRVCCAWYSAIFVLATPSDDFLPHFSVLHFLLQTSAIPSGACCVQYSAVFVPATPNTGCIPQLSVRHFLLQTSTIPSGVCCAQYSAVFVPATPNHGSLSQPSVLHFLRTLTIPSGACCAQYSAVFAPVTPNGVLLLQFRLCTFCCRRRPSRPGRAAHSTQLFLYLPLQTTPSCRSLRFCTSSCRL